MLIRKTQSLSRYHTSNQIELSKPMGINFIQLSSQNKQRINLSDVFFYLDACLDVGGPCQLFPDINTDSYVSLLTHGREE